MGARSATNDEWSSVEEVPTPFQILTILSDPNSVKILKMAYSGLKVSSSGFGGNLSRRQYYTRLKRLSALGLIKKQGRYIYKTTSLGSLIYNSQIRSLEKMLDSYWQLRAVDLLKERAEFPTFQKDKMIRELLSTSQLKDITNSTYLSGFTIAKDFDSLIIEVMRILDNASKEIYFASRYHDTHVANLTFKKFSNGVALHILDGTPSQITVENRINAILRTPPNPETYRNIQSMIRSPKFELFRLESLSNSFLVVDGTQVVYEIVSYENPHEFTVALANYDDPYLAERYIKYFNLLAKDAEIPRLIQTARTPG